MVSIRQFIDILKEAESETEQAKAIILRWVNEEQNSTENWTRLFDSVRPILDASVPDHPMVLWRNERTNDESQYSRYTSWTTEEEIARDYPANGGRNRRLVRAVIDPKSIVCCVSSFGPKVDWLRQQEVIVRPGNYEKHKLEESQNTRAELNIALEEWTSGYEKDDAFELKSGSLELEKRIISLCHNIPHSKYTGMLYRGTGIHDDECEKLLAGETITIKTSPARYIASWTKSRKVAKSFAEDAKENGMSVVIISLPATSLNVLVDVNAVNTKNQHSWEKEVLILNEPITISPKNILMVHKYDGED